MKWITHKGIRVNRIATCWLIRRFADSAAGFFFVPAEEGRYGGRAKRCENNGNCMPQTAAHETGG